MEIKFFFSLYLESHSLDISQFSLNAFLHLQAELDVHFIQILLDKFSNSLGQILLDKNLHL